jgi:acyl-CoA hydrolase
LQLAAKRIFLGAEMTKQVNQEKKLFMTRLMTPDMANFSGNVHGGTILKLLDEAAFSCASRYCKMYVMTAALDHVEFKCPITVGDLVTFKCNINYVGRSSMEVGIRVEGEKIREKTKYHAISCYFTMIAVNEEGIPQKAPSLKIESETEKRLFDAGSMRREMRKETKEKNLQLHVGLDTMIS